MMKKQTLSFVLIVLAIFSCKDKSESMSDQEKIAGKDQKIWIATRETDAGGDKDRLTREEKKETITFWSNGNVKMGDENKSMAGQWSYSGSTLTLQFAGDSVTENFTVLELDNDKMKLKAGDGSQLTMKPK
jgi:hypothetical protein